MLSRFIDKLKRNGRGRNDKEAGRNHRRRKKERKKETEKREKAEILEGGIMYLGVLTFTQQIEFGSESKSSSFCWG